MKIAVLITCFNRRATTLSCLEQLGLQRIDDGHLAVYLVDDGSTDGTANAVRMTYPDVTVIQGDGSLYWTGGMILAERRALQDEPDALLWLNDDVTLRDGSLGTMVAECLARNHASVIVGPVCDPTTGVTTYGGHRRLGASLRMKLVDPTGIPEEVDTMNGNVVLVPARLRDVVGGLDSRYRHNMADMDFAFRAANKGFSIVQVGQFVGECSRNTSKQQWANPKVPLGERLRFVVSFKAFPPSQWLSFTTRHAGWRFPRPFASPYLRALTAGLRDRREGRQ